MLFLQALHSIVQYNSQSVSTLAPFNLAQASHRNPSNGFFAVLEKANKQYNKQKCLAKSNYG